MQVWTPQNLEQLANAAPRPHDQAMARASTPNQIGGNSAAPARDLRKESLGSFDRAVTAACPGLSEDTSTAMRH